jgi:Photosynthetic reaction centre cytochrome C subunit
MRSRWRRKAFVAAIVVNIAVLAAVGATRTAVEAAAQAATTPAQAAQPMAEQVFKDIQVLKGIPADEFMDTMGMFASSLLYDCTGCHVQDILINRDAFATPTPRIQRARQMVVMVNALNRMYFAGQPKVTCFTCHRASGFPEVIPDLSLQYGDGPPDNPNTMTIFPQREGPSAAEIFRKYLDALGGADRVSKLTSFSATGSYIGFNTGGATVPIEIYAKAPSQRASVVRVFDGDAVKVFDGRNGWAAEGWRQIPLMTFTGSNVASMRFEALSAFPAEIEKAFREWKVATVTIADEDVQLLQGSNPGELPVNLYFDESGLLVRTVRWTSTPVGTVPTQTDFSDYRDVDGVKMPFHTVVTWTNGQNTIELKEIRANVAIDAARFARPAPFKPR